MIVTLCMCGFMINAARGDVDYSEDYFSEESDDDKIEVLNEAGVYERL